MKLQKGLFAALIAAAAASAGCLTVLGLDSDYREGKGGGNTMSGPNGGGGVTIAGGNGGGGVMASGPGGGMVGGGGSGGVMASGGSGGSGTPECTTADDCDTGSECIAPTCLAQKCGAENVQSGTLIATQTAGDCKSAVCDGNGGISPQDYGDDVFDDGKDCTLDGCGAGMPESTPATSGTICNDDGGKVCDGLGACVQCNGDADCAAAAPKCAMHVCVPASCNDGVKNGNETATDCGGACGATCVPGATCGAAADCADGVCTGNLCAAPTCNDSVANGAETDKDCGGGACAKCAPTKGCDVSADCIGNQCSGAGGVCVPNCNDGVKNNAETGKDCGGGTCAGCAIGGTCGQDNDCGGTAYCDVTMKCVAKKPNGAPCSGVSQCATGNCSDGVCCNTPCGGTCHVCNLAGNAGTCSPIPAGQDPTDECAGVTAVCDGTGVCKKAPGQGCGGSVECALGNCDDGVCCNTPCGGTCAACNLAGSNGTCTNIANGSDPKGECIGAITCNGNGACGSLLPNGSACGVNNECQSSFCTEGVCCNSVCSGACASCNLAGSVGACTNILNNQDPFGDCTNGACNGAGACRLDNGQACGDGSACLSGNCADGVCCNTACNGICQGCNNAGTPGTCANLANGLETMNECAGSTTCNGAGAVSALSR